MILCFVSLCKDTIKRVQKKIIYCFFMSSVRIFGAAKDTKNLIE